MVGASQLHSQLGSQLVAPCGLHRERFNTGVKGVKADYEEYNKIQQAKREVQRLERLSLIDRITTGKTFQGESMSGSSSAMQNKDKQENDDDDETFLQNYRKARKAQLRQRASLPQFGTLLTVSPVQFLDKVDGAHGHAYVIVHLYDDSLHACRKLDAACTKLASAHPHVCFLRLKMAAGERRA